MQPELREGLDEPGCTPQGFNAPAYVDFEVATTGVTADLQLRQGPNIETIDLVYVKGTTTFRARLYRSTLEPANGVAIGMPLIEPAPTDKAEYIGVPDPKYRLHRIRYQGTHYTVVLGKIEASPSDANP